MTTRLKNLKRLATHYGAIEQIRSLQLHAASSSVAEVVRASRDEAELRRIQLEQSRAALVSGDAEALAMATLERGASKTRQQYLAEMRLVREQLHEQAKDLHQASRERMEQMEKIVERSVDREAIAEGRRTQAASDDRYAARLMWKESTASQSSGKKLASMKLP